MILGAHITFGTYGFWLPNDPRGSWSPYLRGAHLLPFGDVKTVSTRRSIAGQPHDLAVRQAAKLALKYPAVRLTGIQARAVARGFAEIAVKLELIVHACSIMPDHVHLVVRRHNRTARELSGYLKRAATRRLNKEELHPFKKFARINGTLPTPWIIGGWEVFLNTPQDMLRAIEYVERNPVRAGLKPQRWSFVMPYESTQ